MSNNKQNLSLQIPIDAGWSQQDELVQLINDVAATPTGKDLLENVAKQGYSIGIENIDSMGLCSARDKKITLSSTCSYDKLVSSLAHEARHVQQIANGADPIYNSDFLLKDQLIEKRLMEADAVAVSLMVCQELKERGNEAPMIAAKPHYEKETQAFEAGLQVSKQDALTQAALAWYENKNRLFKHECRVVAQPLCFGINFENTSDKYKKLEPADSLNRFCFFEGKPYFTESSDVLKTAERSGISERLKMWLDVHETLCKGEGVQAETSVKDIPVYKDSPQLYGQVNMPPLSMNAYPKIKAYKEAKAMQSQVLLKSSKSR